MEKILRNFTRNFGKLRELTISVIAGLLSGTIIGIFFSLTTDITFNRWINIFSLEIFAAFIYVLFSVVILYILYILGHYFIKSKFGKKSAYSFYLNYIAGTYSSSMVFLLVLYSEENIIRNWIAAMGIIVYLILAYFSIKKKR